MVVLVGETFTVIPFRFPGFQVYVYPAPLPPVPLAVSVAELPIHIAVGRTVAAMESGGLTRTVAVVVAVQPEGSVPVTV